MGTLGCSCACTGLSHGCYSCFLAFLKLSRKWVSESPTCSLSRTAVEDFTCLLVLFSRENMLVILYPAVSYWIIREDAINQNEVSGKGMFVKGALCGRRGRRRLPTSDPRLTAAPETQKGDLGGRSLRLCQTQILSPVSRAPEQRFPGRGCQVGQVWLCFSVLSCATECGQPVESSA